MEIWTVKAILDWSKDFFIKNQIESPQLTAQLLLSSILNLKRLELFLQYDRVLTNLELKKYKDCILKRIKNEPLEYILEEAQFLDKYFRVSPDVLIPRPETEGLVLLAKQLIVDEKIDSVLEVGTGSGVISISLKTFFSDIPFLATDISDKALVIAQKNAHMHKTEIFFKLGSFLPVLGKNGLLISNPPYIKTSDLSELSKEVKKEPMLALDGGVDGTDVIKSLISFFLEENNIKFLLFEFGYDQELILRELFHKKGVNFQLFPDLQGVARYAKLVK